MHLFTTDEYNAAKMKNTLPFKCDQCGKVYNRKKHDYYILSTFKSKTNKDYCSKFCGRASARTRISIKCAHCGTFIYKRPSALKKNQNAFCNHSCSAFYSNSHRAVKGVGVSKLEIWLQENLNSLYPQIEFHFNKNDAINSQLDIYIPSMKLAFELNGAFHYEPIFGKETLNKIQNNDQRKFQACLERGIELCVIDTSHQKYFKASTGRPFLEIIVNIINQKVGAN